MGIGAPGVFGVATTLSPLYVGSGFNRTSFFELFLLTSADPLVDGFFVKAPDPPYPDRRYFAFGGVLTDGYLMKL